MPARSDIVMAWLPLAECGRQAEEERAADGDGHGERERGQIDADGLARDRIRDVQAVGSVGQPHEQVDEPDGEQQSTGAAGGREQEALGELKPEQPPA